MRRAAVPAMLVALALLVPVSGGPVAASPQPVPVCPVCGETFDGNVTATDATLSIEPDGDVRWRVENDVPAATAADWREHPDRLRNRVNAAIDHPNRPPYDPSAPTVDVEDGTVTIGFVDRGAAKQRFGVLVLPYLQGARWVINAERFVVEPLEGARIVNDPALATVEGDRAVWTGASATEYERPLGPEPGDTYVVAGSGPTAGARSAVATALMPLDTDLYLVYGFGLLFVGAAAYALYAFEDRRLGRRREALGLAASVLPYLALMAWIHPPRGGFGGLPLFVGTFLVGLLGALIGGAAMAVWTSGIEGRGEAS